MKLNEHQSKRLLHGFDVPVPPGELLGRDFDPDAAPPYGFPVMLKAQVLSGGRGKAGGILRSENQEELVRQVQKLLSMTIAGHQVPLVRMEPCLQIQKEMYLSLAVQRSTGNTLLTTGSRGGVHIESQSPDTLLIQEVYPGLGLCEYQTRASFFHLGTGRETWEGFRSLLTDLYRCFSSHKLLLAEINPLVLTGEGQWLALDAKIELDDNVLDLRPELREFVQPEHASANELRAREVGLSFHTLSGSVGLVANGAGLAMATMDLLHDAGMEAANFLDLGGGADKARMKAALSILFNDPLVRAVLINIFGGILSCRLVAEALLEALQNMPASKPLVVRFSGFEASQGTELLSRDASDTLVLASDLSQALQELAGILSVTLPDGICGRQDTPGLPPGSATGHSRHPVLQALASGSVLVQGMTGKEGRLHTRLMLEYGTRIVAGVTPFKEGHKVEGLPVYSSVDRALRRHRVDASVIFVPAMMAADAVLEAAEAGIPWIVCITEGIPQQDMLRILPRLKNSNSRLIGPNTPGLLLPGHAKLGIMPGDIFRPGPLAILSRSGTLTYECVSRLSRAGIGQSLCLGIGGDPFVGSAFDEFLPFLADDEQTSGVLVLGEIGGHAEERLARCITATGFDKPVVAFIAGRTAPPGKRLGHAGAILDSPDQGIQSKITALRQAGITMCSNIMDIPACVAQVLPG